jgi:hypothetical protein
MARFSLGARRFLPENYRMEIAEVNDRPAVIIRVGGQAFSVITIDVAAEYIRAIHVIANPEKLARI